MEKGPLYTFKEINALKGVLRDSGDHHEFSDLIERIVKPKLYENIRKSEKHFTGDSLKGMQLIRDILTEYCSSSSQWVYTPFYDPYSALYEIPFEKIPLHLYGDGDFVDPILKWRLTIGK